MRQNHTSCNEQFGINLTVYSFSLSHSVSQMPDQFIARTCFKFSCETYMRYYINAYQGFQQHNDAVYYSVIDSPLQQSAETASRTEIRTDSNEVYVTSERDRQRGNTQQPNDVTCKEVPGPTR